MWKIPKFKWMSEFRQNYYLISFSPTVPPFAARISRIVADGGTWQLKWERLKAGESNGKLPTRTCPGCSVPEPYRSHDWVLVPAKPGLQGWILMNEWKQCLSYESKDQCTKIKKIDDWSYRELSICKHICRSKSMSNCRYLWLWIRGLLSPGMWRNVIWYSTNL